MVESKYDFEAKKKGAKIFGVIWLGVCLLVLVTMLPIAGTFLSPFISGGPLPKVILFETYEVTDPLIVTASILVFFLIFFVILFLFILIGFAIYTSEPLTEYQLIMNGVEFARKNFPDKLPKPELSPVGPVDFVGNEKPKYAGIFSGVVFPILSILVLIGTFLGLVIGLITVFGNPIIMIPGILIGMGVVVSVLNYVGRIIRERPLKGLAEKINFKYVETIASPIKIPLLPSKEPSESITGTYKGINVTITFLGSTEMIREGRRTSRKSQDAPNIEFTLTTPHYFEPIIITSRSTNMIRSGDFTPLDWSKVRAAGSMGKFMVGVADFVGDLTGIDFGMDLSPIQTKDPYLDLAFNIIVKDPAVLPVFQLPWVRSGLLGLGLNTYIKFEGNKVIIKPKLSTFTPPVVYKLLDYFIPLAQQLGKYKQT